VPVELTSQVEVPKVADARGGLHATEDDVLVAAAMKGEATAFAMLVERHKKRIFFTALRMTHNREDAEDVVQQSLQKAFVHFDSFVGRSSFSTWLTRVAMNEALMLLRKKRGRREVLIDDLGGNEDGAIPLEVPDSTPDPEARYSQRESAGMLSLAMKELGPGMRRAIQLRSLDERSMEETARILGISVNAAKGRVFNGRKKLREILKHCFESPWIAGRNISCKTCPELPIACEDQAVCNACG